MCESELITSRLSKVLVRQTYIQTDTTEIIIAPLRSWSKTEATASSAYTVVGQRRGSPEL